MDALIAYLQMLGTDGRFQRLRRRRTNLLRRGYDSMDVIRRRRRLWSVWLMVMFLGHRGLGLLARNKAQVRRARRVFRWRTTAGSQRKRDMP